jgi:hypothetical protein
MAMMGIRHVNMNNASFATGQVAAANDTEVFALSRV